MKKIKMSVCSALALVMTAGVTLSACTPTASQSNDTLVLNLAKGESFVQGTYDDEVRVAIEEKFEQDTGKKLNLKANIYTEAAFNGSIDSMFSSAREQIDAVKHYVVASGSAIINYAKTKDNTIDMREYVEGSVYQQKINENDEKHIVERSGYMNIDGTMSYNVLNDYCNERGYGWAVNKSFWKDAYDAGLTTVNPEEYDASQETYKNLTVSQFEEVMLAIKAVRQNNSDDVEMKTPVWAYGWDILRLFGSLYGVTNLNTVKVEYGGKTFYTPSHLSDGYGEFLEWNAHLVQEGIWESANPSTNDSTRLSYFITGASAVYMAYPDIDMVIDAGRTLEEYTDWEYMICGPLAKEDGTVTGFTKREKTFTGIIVPWHSANAQLLMDYINWMYSDKENYDLCMHGRKGIDWVETTLTVDGVTYEGWKYPDGKEAEYLAKPPYSGLYCVLENVNVSDRIDASYNEKELVYYIRSKYDAGGKGFAYYTDNTATEGVFVGATPSDIVSGETAVGSGWISGPRSQSWSGMWPDKYTSFSEYYEAWRGSLFKDGSKGRKYLDWYTAQVNENLNYFQSKWGIV